tara:strand:+ start:1295 stop:1534 length:240 start_codon:yes stop_codon:yes gene_type:complete
MRGNEPDRISGTTTEVEIAAITERVLFNDPDIGAVPVANEELGSNGKFRMDGSETSASSVLTRAIPASDLCFSIRRCWE